MQDEILTYLGRIEAKLDLLAADMRDIESSLTAIEHHLRGICDVRLMVSGTAIQGSARLDRIETCLDRIERKLGLEPAS